MFSHFKIDLGKQCKFWKSKDLCSKTDCTVFTLNKSQVPELWSKLGEVQLDGFNGMNQLSLKKYKKCEYTDKDFCVLEDEDSIDGVFVNLLHNKEQFTGYSGHSAWQVWEAIYNENCFLTKSNTETLNELEVKTELIKESDQCFEQKVFHKLISGLHASISTHICYDHFNSTSNTWGPNLDCFIERVGKHQDRLENMYFYYGLLLRATHKVTKYLSKHSYCSSDLEQEKMIQNLMLDIYKQVEICPSTFDEKLMFQGPDAIVLKEQFKDRFRNISRVMDCVGCQKCKLWGKIQVGGIGTALKILFSYNPNYLNPKRNPDLFQKTEVVALFNTLGRLSESLEAVEFFKNMYLKQASTEPTPNNTVLSILSKWNVNFIFNLKKIVNTGLEASSNYPGFSLLKQLWIKVLYPLQQ